MKRGVLCCVLAAFLALPASVAAESSGMYIAPRLLVGTQDSGGVSSTPSGTFSQYSESVGGGALAVGYAIAPYPVRAELEAALRSGTSDSKSGADWSSKQSIQLSTLFLNVYFDINTGTNITPFIGLGLGATRSTRELEAQGPGYNYSVSKTEIILPAGNLGLGVSYAFSENVAADLGYRYVYAGNSEAKTGGVKVSSSPYINEFYLGARFGF